MKCPKCQSANGDPRSFCKKCGLQLLLPCSHCGFANEPEDAYCGGCGKNLSAAAPAGSSASIGKAPERSPSRATVPNTFLAELLKEGSEEAQPDPKETKKSVSQEEIDKLFNP